MPKPENSSAEQSSTSLAAPFDSMASDENLIELQASDVACLNKFTCAGQIFMETGKSDKYSAFLIDLDREKLRKVRLDFKKCPNYSVFPGQVAVLEGFNVRGDTLEVLKVHTTIALKHYPLATGFKRPLSMVICAGPYNPPDSLDFSPLADLVAFCNTSPPDVLIMTGAILSAGATTKDALHNVADRFDRYFEKFLDKLVASVSPNTQILLVAAHDDVNSRGIYPTPAYKKRKPPPPNLHLLSDPCVVDVEGLKVGISSVDALGELIEREVNCNNGFDTFRRGVNYLFNSRSFYPLRPPQEVPVDFDLAHKYAKLDKVPHVLICPSSLREFIRVSTFFYLLGRVNRVS